MYRLKDLWDNDALNTLTGKPLTSSNELLQEHSTRIFTVRHFKCHCIPSAMTVNEKHLTFCLISLFSHYNSSFWLQDGLCCFWLINPGTWLFSVFPVFPLPLLFILTSSQLKHSNSLSVSLHCSVLKTWALGSGHTAPSSDEMHCSALKLLRPAQARHAKPTGREDSDSGAKENVHGISLFFSHLLS